MSLSSSSSYPVLIKFLFDCSDGLLISLESEAKKLISSSGGVLEKVLLRQAYPDIEGDLMSERRSKFNMFD